MSQQPKRFSLSTELQYIKGVGPARAEVLARMGITNIRELLYFVPKGKDRYLFYKGYRSISECDEGDEVVVKGTVTNIASRRTRGRKKMFEVTISDGTGSLVGVWFNARSYLEEAFEEKQEVIFRGKVKIYKKLQIAHPQFEILKEENAETVESSITDGNILPVYPETAEFHDRIGQPMFRKIIRNSWDLVKDTLLDPIPEYILREDDLCSIRDMFRFLHFPNSREEIDRGIFRYKFQELFSMGLGIARYSQMIRDKEKKDPVVITDEIDRRIRNRFPFELTNAQERSVLEITNDMSSAKPMNRLLQGDVGAGKTAVAVYAILACVANHRQVAFIAPTGILAEQHFLTFHRMLEDSQVRYALLTGGMKTGERRELLQNIAEGKVDVVIGTHALIQKDVEFRNLSLVIVDEQHKFGVLQRKELADKGYNPDILLMTATPIPRTLSMTAYGEYDISILDEMPPGRREVKTYWFPQKKRDLGYQIIRDKVGRGEQVFIICPLVEESEDLDLKSAIETQEDLQSSVFTDLRVGLLHGRMKQEEKDAVMERFRNREIDILVSTVVVEVGVDIPNATVMVIEHAERFGLAQLHQLRGRIGRGSKQSICILFATSFSESAKERLGIMTQTNDGFKIAEKDFELRGPGEYFGTRQHGAPSFYLANLLYDRLLVYRTRELAFQVLREDPDLVKPEHAYFENLMKRKFQYGVELLGTT